MKADMSLLRTIASSDLDFLILLGIPERLGDRCVGIELDGKRVALLEESEIPSVIDAIDEGRLKRALMSALPQKSSP